MSRRYFVVDPLGVAAELTANAVVDSDIDPSTVYPAPQPYRVEWSGVESLDQVNERLATVLSQVDEMFHSLYRRPTLAIDPDHASTLLPYTGAAVATTGSDYMSRFDVQSMAAVYAASANFVIGTAATVANTAMVTDANGTFTRCRAAVIGTVAHVGATSTLCWIDHDPVYYARIRTGSDITSVRLWFGLIQAAAFTNSDTIATGGCAIRYSTVAGDSGFVGCNYDGVTQSTTASLAAIAANTAYTLKITVSGRGTLVTFQVDDNPAVTLSTNIKTGVATRFDAALIPQVAATRDLFVGSQQTFWTNSA